MATSPVRRPTGAGGAGRHGPGKSKEPTGGVAAGAAPGSDMSKVPRNAVGGVAIDEDELRAAFQFFDVRGTGRVTIQDLKKRLGPFYKSMPMREFKFLMGDDAELTLDSLRSLLEGNEITDFDPCAEAFRVYDPEGTGFVDIGVLKAIFEKLGFDSLSAEDLEILVETADADRDGKISLDDFRNMLAFAGGEQSRTTVTPVVPPKERESSSSGAPSSMAQVASQGKLR